MRIIFILPLLIALSCKGGPEPEISALKKDPKPIMGGPTRFSITLTDYAQGGYAKIIGFYSDQNYLVDSVAFTQGTINYQKKEGLAQGLYYIGVSGRKEYIQLFFGEDQDFDVNVALGDIMGTMQVTGSLENELFYENMRFESTLSPKLNDVANRFKSATPGTEAYTAIKKEKETLENQRLQVINDLYKNYPDLLFASFKHGGQNPRLKEELPRDVQVIQYRKEFWDNVNFSDTRLLRTPMIGIKLKRYLKELTVQHQDSILAAAHHLMDKVKDKDEYFKVFANYVVLTYEPGKSTIMDAEKVFVDMVRKYFTYEKAFWSDSLQTDAIQRRASEMAQSLLGVKAANVISTDNFGKKQELMSKTSEYLIVYLFNPECEHCMIETPKLHKFYLENKSKGLDVYAIAIDTDDAKWKGYIAKNGLSWTNVHDPTNRSIYAKYYVDVTPEIYVLNKDRVIIGKNLKADQVQIIIDRDKAKNKS